MNFVFKINYSKLSSLCLRFSLNKVDRCVHNITGRRVSLDKKIFCVGFGKTGTTSLETALKQFGYKMGNQPVAEMFAQDWYNNNSGRIISFCETANAFQDIPFGMPNLYKELDKYFPNSKFILTIRDNAEVWYNSLVKFHAKKYSKDGVSIPNEVELKNAKYRYKGYALDIKRYVFNYPKVTLYDKKEYCRIYKEHNDDVMKYFKNRPNDLLVLNVAEKNSYQKLAEFLNIQVKSEDKFPWKNKTSQL